MSDWVFLLLALTVPFAVGIGPALLPARVRSWVRWSVALFLLALSIWLFLAGSDPHPYHLVFLVPFWIGWMLGAILMAPWPKAEHASR
jgi:hypothetical protein